MIKLIVILITCVVFISCEKNSNKELTNLNNIPKINYSGNVSQIINSHDEILRFSMDANSFSIFQEANSDRWKEWNTASSEIYITTKNNIDYIFNFVGQSYSIFRDDKQDYSTVIIWRQDIQELWVIKMTILM